MFCFQGKRRERDKQTNNNIPHNSTPSKRCVCTTLSIFTLQPPGIKAEEVPLNNTTTEIASGGAITSPSSTIILPFILNKGVVQCIKWISLATFFSIFFACFLSTKRHSFTHRQSVIQTIIPFQSNLFAISSRSSLPLSNNNSK